jgi:hypothetical protein
MCYLFALAGVNLRGDLDYDDRNYIEKWFQTVTIRIDRFHSILDGQLIQLTPQAEPIQISLQPTATQSGSRRMITC